MNRPTPQIHTQRPRQVHRYRSIAVTVIGGLFLAGSLFAATTLADFFDLTSSVGQQPLELYEKADRQFITLSALFAASLLLAIIFFFYFRHILIARLIRLNRAVLAMIAGENRHAPESMCSRTTDRPLPAPDHLRGARVLLAEDNEINQEITKPIAARLPAGNAHTIHPGESEILPEEMAASSHGIDMRAGLSRTMGNPTLYFNLLAEFIVKYRQFPAIMREEMKMLSFDGVRQMVHTLKGVSGSLAMKTLYTRCIQLEVSIKRKRINECSTLLFEIQVEMEKICNFLRQYLDRHRNRVSNILTISEEMCSGSEDLSSLLASLTDSLRSNSAKAIKEIGRLRFHLEQEDKLVFTRIEKHINDLDFDKAHTLLIQWQDSFRK